MFKKPDPWQTGLKIFTKFLGLDTQQQPPKNQKIRGQNGLMSIRQSIESSVFGKSQQKNYLLKEKWRKLMKFPSRIKHREVIQLLRQGSAIQEETWLWMLGNSQKISQQLYSSRKQQFSEIIYSKSPLSINGLDTQRSIQIEDLEQGLQFSNNTSRKSAKKRKFSITKHSAFIKEQPVRLSLTSQASTFSSQTHQSNELIQPLSTRDIPMYDGPFCSHQARIQAGKRQMKSTCMTVQSSPVVPQMNESVQHVDAVVAQLSNEQLLQSSLMLLPQKITHPVLTSIIGAFLLHREDFQYSTTLFNMTATFYYYTNSSEIKTFTLLNHVACTQFFVLYLTRNWKESGQLICYIADRMRRNCPSAGFLRNFRLENFVENWLYGFFYSICENGSEVKEKIIGYLLINTFSIDSIVRVCQSLIFSLSKVICQGQQDRIYECLQNPKLYIDKNLLFQHLLQQQE